jgi:hypothetical protein
MSDPEVPEWLSQARTGRRVRGPLEARDDWPRLPRVGELRIAVPTVFGQADPRMVVIVDVEPEIGVAEVALVTNEIEFASAEDVVMGAEATGLPFDLLFETEIVGRLWCIQLGRLVAELDSELARTVRRSLREERTRAAATPHVAEDTAALDQRSLFRKRERLELEALSEDCQQALIRHGSASEVVLDPALFDPASEGSRLPMFERWLVVAQNVVRPAPVTVPVGVLESSLESHGIGPRPWSGRPGPDAVRALLPLFERVLAERSPRIGGNLEIVPARRRPADAVDRELISMLSSASKRGCRTVRLLTVSEAWTGEFSEAMAMARFVAADRTELQVIRHNMEAGS